MAPDSFPDPFPDPPAQPSCESPCESSCESPCESPRARRWTTEAVAVRALDGVADVLDAAATAAERSHGLVVLCRLGAELVDADAAGHVRADPGRGSTQLCVWTSEGPDRVRWEERPEPADVEDAAEDWWLHSPSRRRLFELLGRAHLAELPLSPPLSSGLSTGLSSGLSSGLPSGLPSGRGSPTLLVLARDQPFGEDEATRLTTVHGALLLLERLVDVLLPAPPGSRPADGATPVLTARERAVLELLGEGLLARSIAARLEVSERTVHKHLGSIYRKLDAHDRLLAVRRGESLGFIPARAPATAAVR